MGFRLLGFGVQRFQGLGFGGAGFRCLGFRGEARGSGFSTLYCSAKLPLNVFYWSPLKGTWGVGIGI